MLTSRADHMAPHQLASAGDGQKKSRHSVTDDGTMWGRAGHFRGSPLTLCASFWSVWPHRAAVVRWSGFLRRIAGCWLLVAVCLARSLHKDKSGRALNWMDCCAGLIGQVGRRIHLRASERCVSCSMFHMVWIQYGTMSGRRRS